MSKQVQDAYIVAVQRSPVGKAPRGMLRNTRPEDLIIHAIKGTLAKCPGLDPADIEDLILGCAMPEAEQGLNVARIVALLAGLPYTVPGVTINRFCASGLQAVAWAADRVRLGESDVILAGGVESMSAVPMGGNSPAIHPEVFTKNENVGIAYGMGLTAERVAERWNVTREAQDDFAVKSHQKALAAIESGAWSDEILPFTIRERVPSPDGKTIIERVTEMKVDE
ncbi:MAG: acetyl-CoA acetyltransferase, partial [Beggiatoa sp. IS2]